MARRTGSLKARRAVLTSLKPVAFRLPLNPIITKDPYGTQQRTAQHLNLHQQHHRRHGLGNRRHFGGEAVDAIQRNDFGRYVSVSSIGFLLVVVIGYLAQKHSEQHYYARLVRLAEWLFSLSLLLVVAAALVLLYAEA